MLLKVSQGMRGLLMRIQAQRYGRPQARYSQDLSFTEAARRFPDRGELYRYMYHYFRNLVPPTIRDHRAYFSQENRGFGEDAFHAMWFTLLREFQPRNCLEIGIYRGQTISLWALIAEMVSFDCELYGISPFSSAGDQASRYSDRVDYLADTQQSFRRFSSKPVHLLKAYSTDATARDYITARSWDLVYIDGSHDYDVALADYQICRDNLAPGGLLVLDDSSLYTDYRPPLFGFSGHPGPSRVLRDFAMKELQFLGAVGHNNILRKA
jgi:predicted O-methyltransferase YrrM